MTSSVFLVSISSLKTPNHRSSFGGNMVKQVIPFRIGNAFDVFLDPQIITTLIAPSPSAILHKYHRMSAGLVLGHYQPLGALLLLCGFLPSLQCGHISSLFSSESRLQPLLLVLSFESLIDPPETAFSTIFI